MMSDSKAVWLVLWERAARDASPFEIREVVPIAAERLPTDPRHAERLILGLLQELERLPDGQQFFRAEGNAVAVLPEFQDAPKDRNAALGAYPFEI